MSSKQWTITIRHTARARTLLLVVCKSVYAAAPVFHRQTSSKYTIPPGWVYGDIKIRMSTSRPGTLDVKSGGTGVLRVEQAVGLLGAATELVACGTFDAKVNYGDNTTPGNLKQQPTSPPTPSSTDTPSGGTL